MKPLLLLSTPPLLSQPWVVHVEIQWLDARRKGRKIEFETSRPAAGRTSSMHWTRHASRDCSDATARGRWTREPRVALRQYALALSARCVCVSSSPRSYERHPHRHRHSLSSSCSSSQCVKQIAAAVAASSAVGVTNHVMCSVLALITTLVVVFSSHSVSVDAVESVGHTARELTFTGLRYFCINSI